MEQRFLEIGSKKSVDDGATVFGNPARPRGGYCANRYLMGSIRCAA